MIGAVAEPSLDWLPRYATTFVGRNTEQADLLRLVLAPATRLVTLTGPGGVGKTRLAVETIRRHADVVRDACPDGVLFVDLAPVATSDRVLLALASALELPESSEVELVVAITAAIGTRAALLVLDNFEQVAAAGSDLAAVASGCPALKLVVTSRTPLHVAGEQLYAVPPLAIDDADEGGALADAVVLYAARARQVDAAFQLDERTRPVVRQICRRLDGLPLAIELAVPRLRVISNEALLARLEHRLQVLDRGPVDGVVRHRTLDATIDWSVRLLTSRIQAIFRRLSVVPDAFSLDAASAIGGHNATLDDIAVLVDQALLQPTTGNRPAEPRFRMLATVREYASAQLRESDDQALAEDALVDYCVGLLERAEPELTGTEQATWIATLTDDVESIRAALELTIPVPGNDAPLRIIAAAWRFWWARGTLTEARNWIERTLAVRVADESPIWARASYAAGIIAVLQHDYPTATAWASQALGIYERLNDHAGQARCWLELGHIAGDTGGFERALDCYEHSAATAQDAGDLRAEVLARCGLANLENRRGHDDAAAGYYAAVLPLVRSLRDEWSLAPLLMNYGVILARQRKVTQARLVQEEALTIHRKHGNRPGVAMVLINLEEMSPSDGAHLREALAIARDVGDAELTLTALVNLAEQAAKASDRPVTIRLLDEAVALAQETSMPVAICETLDRVAALIAVAFPERAARLLAATERLRTEFGVQWTGARAEAFQATERALRVRLGPEAFAAESVAGAVLSPADAAVEARAGLAFLTTDMDSAVSVKPRTGSPLDDLTRRELDVLRLIATGASDRDIGSELFISPKTANHHVTRILSKLGCSSRAAAAAIAVRAGID